MSYETELTFAQDLAHEAGKIMLRYFRAEDIGTEWKDDNTPLTIADTTINSLVIERVKAAFPSHGVIGEEESHDNDGDFVWVVDPIDGTVPFSLGIPVSTFSLALVKKSDGQPVVGVAYDPQLDHLYSAEEGKGAYMNGVLLSTSKATDLKRSYVSVLGGTERGDPGHAQFKPGKCSDILRNQGAKYISLQSQVYAAAKVATGEFIGSVFGYGAPWDSAAVVLLVKEAGGVVTDLEGKQRRYDEFAAGCILAANKTIHAKLLKAVCDSAP